jgi:integrase
MSWAARRGLIPANPVHQLEKGERPEKRKRQRILDRNEIGRLLEAAGNDLQRTLLAVSLFTGMRLMELLALRWQDVHFEEGFIRVDGQLSRTGERVDLKTEAGRRDIILMPEIAGLLRAHRLASRFSDEKDYVSPRRLEPQSGFGTSSDGSWMPLSSGRS